MGSTDLFQEDVPLPAQYWEPFSRKRDLEPEKRLPLAVLDNAVRSYRTLVFTGGRRFAEVENWLFNDESDDPFSFRNICDVLGLSPSRIRSSLRTWRSSEAHHPTEKRPRPRARSYDRAHELGQMLARRSAP